MLTNPVIAAYLYPQYLKLRRDPPKWIIFIVILIVILILLAGLAQASEIDMSAIAKIESGNNPMAYNSHTQATGLYQITPVCLADFRQNCKWGFTEFQLDNFTMENMFNDYYNTLVARWYLNDRIPQLLKHYGKPITTENILFAYNAGIGRVIKGICPSETRNYIKKYQKLAKQ